MSKQAFARNLRQLREAAKMTQADMAARLGITPASAGFYETGRREPNLEMEEKIADLFGVSLDYLHGRESGDMQPAAGHVVTDADVILLAEVLRRLNKHRQTSGGGIELKDLFDDDK